MIGVQDDVLHTECMRLMQMQPQACSQPVSTSELNSQYSSSDGPDDPSFEICRVIVNVHI